MDPGLGTTGWGVIRSTPHGPKYVESGRIRTNPQEPIGQRLTEIYSTLQSVVDQYQITIGAVESGFVGKSPMSALKLGEARAAAVLALEMKGIPVSTPSPREIKLAVTGRGAASKQQVSYMVGRILGLEFDSGEEDISDALAAALCRIMLRRPENALTI
ncbi:MAG: crossover junction endodeoxyribonuclease RuvC [Calditrichota bacterium]